MSMNTRTIIVTMLAGMIVLAGTAVYFMIQSNRLSGKLVLASKLIQEATKNNLTDNEYYLRREYARIRATDERIAELKIFSVGQKDHMPIADFAGRRADARRLYMYFSPTVCEACLYNEMEMQDSLFAHGKFGLEVTILASKDYIQNLRAKFQGRKLSCDYAMVDYGALEAGSILMTINEPLLFRWDEGRAKDIFVPSKSNRRYSELYYRYLGGY